MYPLHTRTTNCVDHYVGLAFTMAGLTAHSNYCYRQPENHNLMIG